MTDPNLKVAWVVSVAPADAVSREGASTQKAAEGVGQYPGKGSGVRGLPGARRRATDVVMMLSPDLAEAHAAADWRFPGRILGMSRGGAGRQVPHSLAKL